MSISIIVTHSTPNSISYKPWNHVLVLLLVWAGVNSCWMNRISISIKLISRRKHHMINMQNVQHKRSLQRLACKVDFARVILRCKGIMKVLRDDWPSLWWCSGKWVEQRSGVTHCSARLLLSSRGICCQWTCKAFPLPHGLIYLIVYGEKPQVSSDVEHGVKVRGIAHQLNGPGAPFLLPDHPNTMILQSAVSKR